MRKVIDLAKWNKVSSYESVKAAGVEGAIVKVINSANSPDERFVEHCNGLRRANIPISGGYNYLYANTKAKATAVAPIFIKNCKEQGIKIAWMDIEDPCMQGIGSTMMDVINIYLYYAKLYDIYIGIYTTLYFYNTYIKPYESKMEYKVPIWIARYPSATKEYSVKDNIPSTSWLPQNMDIDGWQFTSKCRIPGIVGYVDLSAWWEETPFVNLEPSVIIDHNPFTEPTQNVKAGAMGNDANWVLWYLWKFGKLIDGAGNADSTKIDGMIGDIDAELIKEVQEILALEKDGIVGKITRAQWKKIC